MGTDVWPIQIVQRSILSSISTPYFIGDEFSATSISHNRTPFQRVGWNWVWMVGGPSKMDCGGLMRDHNGTWIFGFSSFEGNGNSHLAKLLVVIRQNCWLSSVVLVLALWGSQTNLWSGLFRCGTWSIANGCSEFALLCCVSSPNKVSSSARVGSCYQTCI